MCKQGVPIRLLDAIWLKLLKPTGAYRHDSRGRLRAVQAKHKVARLVARALWPNGTGEGLEWTLASGQDETSWAALLVRRETRGGYAQRGWRLILPDGNAALMAALARIYPPVPHQRCRFHKFRPLWQAMVLPPPLDSLTARAFKPSSMPLPTCKRSVVGMNSVANGRPPTALW